jgi:ribosome biogenesis GTPase A
MVTSLYLQPSAGFVYLAANRHTSGDPLRIAQRVLDDFRRSLLGPIALELPANPAGLRA